jgi:ACR3 family arsenite transporter
MASQQQPAMSVFERWLSVWVALCILAGVMAGQLFPSFFKTVSGLEIAHVNLPVGVLIWVMVIPMLLKVDFSAVQCTKYDNMPAASGSPSSSTGW